MKRIITHDIKMRELKSCIENLRYECNDYHNRMHLTFPMLRGYNLRIITRYL